MAASAAVPTSTAEELAAEVRGFFQRHASVALWENGRRVALLAGERAGFALHVEGGRLVCHFWSPDANLVRRVSAVAPGPGTRLRLHSWRLGQTQPAWMTLQPGGDPGSGNGAGREAFRMVLLAAAERSWPGWHYVPGGAREGGRGAGANGLQRLLLQRHEAVLACVAVDDDESAATASAALADGLALAHTAHAGTLRLVVPTAAAGGLATRIRALRTPPKIELCRLDRSSGDIEPIEDADIGGNATAGLRRALGDAVPDGAAAAVLAQVQEQSPQARWEVGPDGAGRVSVYGLAVVHAAGGADALVAPFTFGVGMERTPLLPATQAQFQRFLKEVGRQRVPGGHRRDPLFSAQPEHWLEHVLRHDLGLLDVHLDPRFVYSQVPACRPWQRDILDLLAIGRDGRLVVIELKADEDLEFPLQGLDYWLRVRHHQQAGDFERLGYFPGCTLSPLPPRLWLVAPALRWHPRSDPIYAALAPDIPWTRIGINEEWRRGIQVVFRREQGHGGS